LFFLTGEQVNRLKTSGGSAGSYGSKMPIASLRILRRIGSFEGLAPGRNGSPWEEGMVEHPSGDAGESPGEEDPEIAQRVILKYWISGLAGTG
jgi:hypothetical protein